MTTQYVTYVLIGIMISSITLTIPAFGAGLEEHNVPPLSVSTDNDSYGQGDTVVITGLVKSPEEGIPVTLRILDSKNALIQIDQFLPAADGSFSKTYIATGPLWKPAGNYTVVVQYGAAQQADTTFSFSGGTGTTEKNPVTEDTFTIDVGDAGIYDIDYIIKGGTVENMEIDVDAFALIVTIDATNDGTLTVDLPRNFIESKKRADLTPDEVLAGKTVKMEDLEDDDFLVVIDGDDEAQFKETKSSKESRTLSIQFSAGDSEIEIIGTWIVPEFGPIAALVLAVAIISIIAVSAKTRLRLVPKF